MYIYNYMYLFKYDVLPGVGSKIGIVFEGSGVEVPG